MLSCLRSFYFLLAMNIHRMFTFRSRPPFSGANVAKNQQSAVFVYILFSNLWRWSSVDALRATFFGTKEGC